MPEQRHSVTNAMKTCRGEKPDGTAYLEGFRSATPDEERFASKQSEKTERESGCVGYMRSSVNALFGDYYISSLESAGGVPFMTAKTRMERAYNALRRDAVLHTVFTGRSAARRFCEQRPGALAKTGEGHVFRADTEDLAVLMRLEPSKDEGISCAFYLKDMLDRSVGAQRTEETCCQRDL